MRLFLSNYTQNPFNTEYGKEAIVSTLEDLKKVVRFDHIAAQMKDSHRENGNFLASDCIMLDLDNTHSEEPDEWKTLDDIMDAFPDVRFYYAHSRNHMKEKTKKGKGGAVVHFAPREKFHIYLPLSRTYTDRNEYEKNMAKALTVFPFFDHAAAKAAQFFYGVKSPEAGEVEGALFLDEFLEGVPDPERPAQPEPAKVSVSGYTEESLQIAEAERNQRLSWLHRWAEKNNVSLRREYHINTREHPKAICVCVDCPWGQEHTTEGPENETVIIIDLGGKLNYLCRHSHGGFYSWKDYRAYYEPEPQRPQKVDAELTNAGEDPEQGNADPVYLKFVNKEGWPLNKRTNYDSILQDDDFLKDKFSYNLMDGRIYAAGLPWNLDRHPITDIDLCNVQSYICDKYRLDDIKHIKNAVMSAADNNSFHPVREILEEIRGTWDGTERIKGLLPRYLGAARSDYTTAVTKLMFFGIIQRTMQPGCKFDVVPVLKGPQGCGKSTIVRFLSLEDKFFTDGLRNLESEDAFTKIRGKLIIELSEMMFVKGTAKIEAIKQFLSATSDLYREKYKIYAEDYLRQCVFIGTTDKEEPLPDDRAGNRRYFLIPCTGKPERHPLEDENETRTFIKQCFAEALYYGDRDGYELRPPLWVESYAKELNKSATPEDYRVGMIQQWLDTSAPNVVCTRMIWEEVFSNGSKQGEPKRVDLIEIGQIMTTQITGWQKYNTTDAQKRFQNYGKQRAWERIIDYPVDTPVDTFNGLVDTDEGEI